MHGYPKITCVKKKQLATLSVQRTQYVGKRTTSPGVKYKNITNGIAAGMTPITRNTQTTTRFYHSTSRYHTPIQQVLRSPGSHKRGHPTFLRLLHDSSKYDHTYLVAELFPVTPHERYSVERIGYGHRYPSEFERQQKKMKCVSPL